MEGKIDIKALIRKLTSRWYYFLFTLLIVLPLAYVYTEFTNRIYHIRSSMLLNSETKNGIQSEEFLKGMKLLAPKTEIEDEVGILKSYNLVNNAIQKLDFGISYFEKRNFKIFEQYGDFPFTVVLDSAIDQMVHVPIFIKRTSDDTYSIQVSSENVGTYNYKTGKSGETIPRVDIHAVCFNNKPFEHENLKFRIFFKDRFEVSTDETNYFFIIYDLPSVTESYQQKLDVKPISRESNIVEINLKGTVPKKEILFLNTLMDVYLLNELQKRNQLGLRTIEFIDDQLRGVSEELQQVEGSLESFRSRNNILSINATAENLAKNLDRLEIDKLKLESKLRYYESISRALERGNEIKDTELPSTFGLEDPVLNNLILELSKFNQERIGLNYTSKEGNPVVEVLDLKIASLKKALADNVSNFIEASTTALADLNRQIQQTEGVVRKLPKSERELVSIQRRFDFNDNVYSYLLEKRAEAGIAIASNTIEKTIVDRAKQVGSGPVFPNRKLILLLALIGGIGLSVVLIIVKDLISDNIVTQEDLENSTMIPFIGAISHGNKSDRSSAIVAHTRTELGESFRSLRVNLQYLTLGKEDNVIGVTSSITNEGKTFCSINLAAALALSGRKTVLIDADLRKPRVAASLQINSELGLSSFLAGDCEINDIINATPLDELNVIPSGPIPPNPLDLIGNQKMEELIRDLKKVYDVVVIDSPPIGYVSEYVILMKYTNANIYVVRSNYTSRNHLEKINKLYQDKKIRNVSILLNDLKPSTNGYRYAY
jgi:capsular exopolysaccharide synthesis family protein